MTSPADHRGERASSLVLAEQEVLAAKHLVDEALEELRTPDGLRRLNFGNTALAAIGRLEAALRHEEASRR